MLRNQILEMHFGIQSPYGGKTHRPSHQTPPNIPLGPMALVKGGLKASPPVRLYKGVAFLYWPSALLMDAFHREQSPEVNSLRDD